MLRSTVIFVFESEGRGTGCASPKVVDAAPKEVTDCFSAAVHGALDLDVCPAAGVHAVPKGWNAPTALFNGWNVLRSTVFIVRPEVKKRNLSLIHI